MIKRAWSILRGNAISMERTQAMDYSAVINHMRAARHDISEIQCGDQGRAAVCRLGGRILGLRFKGSEENLLWVSPQIADHALLREAPTKIPGGIGGERLWFGPEYAFNWDGLPDDQNFSNYVLQPSYDPSAYEWAVTTEEMICLKASPTLEDLRDHTRLGFTVKRTISATPPPLEPDSQCMKGVEFAGLWLQHMLQLDEAPPEKCLDLWHILQIPQGSQILIPTTGPARPLVYFDGHRRGGWECKEDRLAWNVRGTACAKIGLDLDQVTGRFGALRQMQDGKWLLMVYQFPVMPGLQYCDGPDAARARNQIVQLWDGFDFGEMEYHSPAVDRDHPMCVEASLLWCFGGPLESVQGVAQKLLGRKWDL